MRLVCPNCDAKYEVSDDAIPEGGRDVQCSACGHAWFQLRPEAVAAAEEEAELFGDDLPPAPPEETQPKQAEPAAQAAEAVAEAAMDVPAAAPPAVPDADIEAAISAVLAGDAPAEAAPSATPVAAAAAAIGAEASPALPRQELDDEVLAVLREEAERETEARRAQEQKAGARRAEAEGQMQVQPDLGVDVAPPPAALSPTQRRLAMLKGKNPDAPPPEPARPAARRDLLPDVEEINSTLQPDDAAALDAEIDALPDLTRRRAGFRSGFLLMLMLLIFAAAAYLAAPKLAEQFPALASALQSYVAFVDGLRLWLNDLMNSATQALNGDGG